MLDHIGLAVADFDRARAFYRAALKPLGLGVVMEVTAEETGGGAHAGFGDEDKPFFWIGTGAKPKGGAHVAFAAQTRAEVDAFHAAAITAGGRDMRAALGLRACADPEERLVLVAEPRVGAAARLLRRHLHDDAKSERL